MKDPRFVKAVHARLLSCLDWNTAIQAQLAYDQIAYFRSNRAGLSDVEFDRLAAALKVSAP